jgi:hypothetical protein
MSSDGDHGQITENKGGASSIPPVVYGPHSWKSSSSRVSLDEARPLCQESPQ